MASHLIVVLACLSTVPTLGVDARPRPSDGDRLYAKISQVYKRYGKKKADLEFNALSKAQKLMVKSAMANSKVIRFYVRKGELPRGVRASAAGEAATAEDFTTADHATCYGSAAEPIVATSVYGKDLPLIGDVVHFEYHQAIWWCGTSGQAIAADPPSGCYAWGDNTNWGYSYQGELEGKRCQLQGAAGQANIAYFSQGKFQPCVLKYGCGVTVTPWIRQIAWGNGNDNVERGG
jgi:hypothetical protein